MYTMQLNCNCITETNDVVAVAKETIMITSEWHDATLHPRNITRTRQQLLFAHQMAYSECLFDKNTRSTLAASSEIRCDTPEKKKQH